jgi:hypothetical protein
MIEILQVHLEEIKDNIKNIEKSILRKLECNDDLSHRFLDNDCLKLIHTLECLKEIVENIKQKNSREWIVRRQQ